MNPIMSVQEIQRVGLDRALVPRHDCGSVYIRESVYGSEIKLINSDQINSEKLIQIKKSRRKLQESKYLKAKKMGIFVVSQESNHKIDWEQQSQLKAFLMPGIQIQDH